MGEAVHLERVRAALTRLDRLALEHPELTSDAARARLARAPCLALDPRDLVEHEPEEVTSAGKPKP